MTIRFHKGRDAFVLACIRDDGSHTWNRFTGAKRAMIVHDMIHYAVETTLGWHDAFFGLVNAGWDIPDFEEPGTARELPPQALQAEVLVGLLQARVHTAPGEEAEFLAMLRQSCEQAGIAPPRLTHDQLRAVRTAFDRLMIRWSGLPEGATLEMEFQ